MRHMKGTHRYSVLALASLLLLGSRCGSSASAVRAGLLRVDEVGVAASRADDLGLLRPSGAGGTALGEELRAVGNSLELTGDSISASDRDEAGKAVVGVLWDTACAVFDGALPEDVAEVAPWLVNAAVKVGLGVSESDAASLAEKVLDGLQSDGDTDACDVVRF